MARRLALMIALVVGLGAPAWAGFDEGLAAYERGDYEIALREFRPLAEQGLAVAQNNLGVMYAEGQGVAQDYAEAAKWYRKAAKQDNAAAQSGLGGIYANGQGVPQDYAEAMKWYRLAAEQRYAVAQYNLGVMYFKGWGVARDYVQAHMWFNLAATQGHETAREARDTFSDFMTPGQIAEAQRLAREWRPKVPLKPDENLRLMQSLLKWRGYDSGPVDGLMGERTRSAIASFKANMASTGTISEIDRALLELIEGLPK